MSDTRFTDQLRQANADVWEQAVGHRFVQQLWAGQVPDEVMAHYLVQDYRFLDSFLTLLGAAIATADTLQARLRLGRFAGMISSDENTYFLRCFDSLGVSEQRRLREPDAAPTAGFQALMREAAATRDYAAALAVLTVAEWLYLDWAARGTDAGRPMPARFEHAEWITLHDNPFFRDFVAFLRAELDRVGVASAAASARAHDFFRRAVALELAFFDEAYKA